MCEFFLINSQLFIVIIINDWLDSGEGRSMFMMLIRVVGKLESKIKYQTNWAY